MNKLLQLSISIVLLFLVTFNAMAKDNVSKSVTACEHKRSIKKSSQCLDDVIDKVDRELQTWVNNQTFNLQDLALKTGRSSALSLFKSSQNSFIQFRENDCRWQYLAVFLNSNANLIYKKCYIMLSENRIYELSHPIK